MIEEHVYRVGEKVRIVREVSFGQGIELPEGTKGTISDTNMLGGRFLGFIPESRPNCIAFLILPTWIEPIQE